MSDLVHDDSSNLGKDLITEHFTGEMRRRNLDPALLTFQWVDDGNKSLALRIFRGTKRYQLIFSRADVENWPMKSQLFGKYKRGILEAINRLLQAG